MHLANTAAIFFFATSLVTPIQHASINPDFTTDNYHQQNIASTDPDLEPGFPAQMFQSSGTYWNGASINTLVANINDDPRQEIFGSALGRGPLYGWNFYGSLLDGWPPPANQGAIYAAAGRLLPGSSQLQVIGADFDGNLVAYNSEGQPLPGWPQSNAAGGLVAPILADFNSDGVDEILAAGLYNLRILSANGAPLPGWPITVHPKIAGMATADFNADGRFEIVIFTEPGNGFTCARIYSDNGSLLSNCPVNIIGDARMYPAIGDVDGDKNLEIVVNSASQIAILNASGEVKRFIPTSQSFYGTPPVLADLNGDAIPEILVLTNNTMFAFNGDGSNFPGWPVPMSGYSTEKTTPVVGDVDGDQLMEIVVFADGLYIFNQDGTLFQKKTITATQLSPAIADFDLDGRNEVICTLYNWGGFTGFEDAVWAFDFGGGPHGKIEWGQYGGGPQHQGVYPVPTLARPKTGYTVYLPLIMGSNVVKPQWLRGQFNLNGIPLEGLPVSLVLDDGILQQSIQSVYTDASGQYQFSSFPPLSADQFYYVGVALGSNPYGLLSLWMSRELKTVRYDSQIDIGKVNLANVPLLSPDNNFSGNLPITFTWGLRSTPAMEYYALELFNPINFNPDYLDIPSQENSGVTIYALPTGFTINQGIGWDVWVFGADGSFGISNESRVFTPTSAGLTTLEIPEDDPWTVITRPRY